MDDLTPYEKTLIKHLRHEAESVKQCFTQFSFQVIALCAIALGLLARFQPNYPMLGLASIAIVLLSLSVARIGTYKYGTANRSTGYELYLDRVRRMNNSYGWKKGYREIGWEEALRAWRTVQATVFRHYYNWGPSKKNTLRKEHRNNKEHWFEPETLHEEHAVYYAGSYLRTMLSILFTIAIFGLISLVIMVGQLAFEGKILEAVCSGVATIAIIVATSIKIDHLSQRRRLLEGGILCIHSCAITWQLVVTAHHRALGKLHGYDDGQLACYEGYTRELSKQAANLKIYLEEGGTPHGWIHTPPTKRQGADIAIQKENVGISYHRNESEGTEDDNTSSKIVVDDKESSKHPAS